MEPKVEEIKPVVSEKEEKKIDNEILNPVVTYKCWICHATGKGRFPTCKGFRIVYVGDISQRVQGEFDEKKETTEEFKAKEKELNVAHFKAELDRMGRGEPMDSSYYDDVSKFHEMRMRLCLKCCAGFCAKCRTYKKPEEGEYLYSYQFVMNSNAMFMKEYEYEKDVTKKKEIEKVVRANIVSHSTWVCFECVDKELVQDEKPIEKEEPIILVNPLVQNGTIKEEVVLEKKE